LNWITSGEKALLIYGVRQAGKTYIIRACLEQSGCDYVEFNLIRQAEIVDIFAKNGIDLTQKYKSFGNANLLLLAIGHDKGLKITDYLIKKGLTLNSKDDEGRGVFYYASLVGNNLDNLKELVKRGVKYDNSALLAVAQGAHKVTNGLAAYQYLIDTLKLNPKITSPEGETLLHFVAKKANQDDVITYLIAKGVDAKKADKFGNTPFLLACSGKSVNAVKYLLPLHRR